MLGNSRETLVEEELEALVVGADSKRMSPKIRPPMTDSLDQPNELALISWQLGVVRSNRPAEKCNSAVALVQHPAPDASQSTRNRLVKSGS